jgi:Cu/Ag efflux protein CusF
MGDPMTARSIMVVGMAAVLLAFASFCTAGEKPGGAVEDLLVVTSIVEKVDLKTREVSLRGEDNRLETIKVGPDARNLEQLKVGDRVTLKYYQALAIFIAPPGEQPSRSETSDVQRAPVGSKPGGRATNVVEATAKIEALDLQKRTATIRGPRGNVHTLKVGDEVRLDKVQVGDLVKVRYTEAVAVSVDKP